MSTARLRSLAEAADRTSLVDGSLPRKRSCWAQAAKLARRVRKGALFRMAAGGAWVASMLLGRRRHASNTRSDGVMRGRRGRLRHHG
jgi:hypothetical protein